MAWNKGARQIVCESDCQELVDIVLNRAHVQQHAQTGVIQDIFVLMNMTWHVELAWIPREINCAADWMAKQAVRCGNPGFHHVDSPPHELEVFILQDMLGVP
ncbi:uncharacterized protein LOC130743947 [Lotus japonicus]|uniref:uncharacterized protein LOC130743947 n=1 Tax=Lotus japonicus TaxID=34305 RepID=UPI00258C581D|nr:uncharacterized protein LOC130743947 [Lotus japonicus]